jgi:hypothetical protein
MAGICSAAISFVAELDNDVNRSGKVHLNEWFVDQWSVYRFSVL